MRSPARPSCQINIEEDGTITIRATEAAKADEASAASRILTGEIGGYHERCRVLDTGALINLLPSKDSLHQPDRHERGRG